MAYRIRDYKKYLRYLQSDHWQRKKAKFFASKPIQKLKAAHGRYVCEACKSDEFPLHVHHRTYKRLYNEWIMDLVLLCSECHELLHKTLKEELERKGPYRVNLWYHSKNIVRSGGRKGKRK